MKTFGAAWRFLTIFPFLTRHGSDEADLLRRSGYAFPAVGLVLGLAAGLTTWLLGTVLPIPVTAALTVAVLALFSSGLHLDGVADCGDALMSPGRDREKCLAIMKDSRIGAHGAMALILLLIVKFACLASASGREEAAVLAFLMPLAGRTGMLWVMGLLPYGRTDGLGKLIRVDYAVIAVGMLVLVVVGAVVTTPLRLVTMVAVWLVVSLGWTLYLKRRLGGATGDCYGAACELAETAAAIGFLLVV